MLVENATATRVRRHGAKQTRDTYWVMVLPGEPFIRDDLVGIHVMSVATDSVQTAGYYSPAVPASHC